MLPALCYGLLIFAWVIDLLTPQLFVAAILLNGPIALSALALRPRLTIWLTVSAEVANVVAGFANGMQDGGRWNAIALGDRALSAASFVLVGALTIRAQQHAREAGEAEERARQIERERSLRHAMERVRGSLNAELVLRAAVDEVKRLVGANRARVAVRNASFDVADVYEMCDEDIEPRVRRERLAAHESSLVERALSAGRTIAISGDDPVGRLIGETVLVSAIDVDGATASLFLAWNDVRETAADLALVQAFADNLCIALRQARMFVQIAESNHEVARKNRELRERGNVIRDLVYALAHDLRTPLIAADLTMSQALAGSYGELPAAYRRVLAASVCANSDLRRLVETLLLVARYEAGEDSRAYARFAIKPLLQRILDEMSPIAQHKEVALRFQATDDVNLDADADEIRRAVVNLLSNAIAATPSGGDVSLSARCDGDLRIEVSDTGYGVPAERREDLFERFTRVRGGTGTGLGLYIVRRIAEKYGGRVDYEPLEPHGSRFTLQLPVTDIVS